MEPALNLKTRTVKLGYAQRAAAHYASQTDVDEAFTCGTAAVQAAVQGQSGYMVKLVRESDEPYRWTTGHSRWMTSPIWSISSRAIGSPKTAGCRMRSLKPMLGR